MPRIISDELFDSVSKILCSRKRLKNYHGKRQTYLITGKIFCRNCGSAYCGGIRYSGKRYTPYVFYTCSKKQRQAGMTCKTKEIRKEYIEEYVLKEILRTVLSDEKIPTLVKKYQDFYANKIGVAEDELNTIRSNIKSCETKNSNLVSVIAKSGIAAC
jgi:site-specific DNA recombinase